MDPRASGLGEGRAIRGWSQGSGSQATLESARRMFLDDVSCISLEHAVDPVTEHVVRPSVSVELG
jgi:hypothetical protein